MKKLVLFFMVIISANVIFAQGKENTSALSRKEKRKAEIEKQYQLTKQILENKNFVLETDYLQNRYGYRIPVSSNINFVKVEPGKAVIQIGSHYGIGPNGVGGITAKGKITSWDLTENEKNMTFDLKMNVMTPIGIYDLQFSISPSGNTTARLTGISSGYLKFDGDLVPLDKSLIYEGWSI